jgi:hypothetical protein
MVLLPGGHLLIAKEKKPAAFIEFGPPHSRSRGLGRSGALAAGKRWPIKRGRHTFVALAIWLPDKKLAKTCADFSDLEIGPDGYSICSVTNPLRLRGSMISPRMRGGSAM